MKQSVKKLLNQLYSQCNDLASYSHHLTESQCDDAFRRVRDIVLFIKADSDSESDYDDAVWASAQLNQLVDLAKNGKENI